MKHLIRLSIPLFLSALLMGQGGGVQSFPFSVGAPPPVSNVTCFTVGTPGNTTVGQTGYYYWVVAIYPIGHVPPTGGNPSCFIPNANNTLTGGNFDTISWTAPPVPSATNVTYTVVRSTAAVFPGTGTVAVNASPTANLTLNDQSNSLNAYTFVSSAAANGQLIYNNRDGASPFLIFLDGNGGSTQNFFSPNFTYSIETTATQAQINAGLTVAGSAVGRTLKVVGYFAKVTGAFATCTDVRISDTSGGPVDVTTLAQAGLTNGAIFNEGVTASTTLGTFGAQLTANQGIQIRQTGAACTGGTNIFFRILYKVNS